MTTAAGNQGRRKKNPVSVRGPWFPMPLDFLRSRACAELSPHAIKMLIDLASGLGPNASGNGDLSAAPAVMEPKGWRSNASRNAALRELEGAGLIAVMRRGNRRACTLYAITLWPLQCDMSKLDYGPSAFTTRDWFEGKADRAERPTTESPAVWKATRSGEKSCPVAGQPPAVMNPQRGNPTRVKRRYEPVAGSKAAIPAVEVVPQRVTFLDMPSAGVASQPCSVPRVMPDEMRMAAILRRARPDLATRSTSYRSARARFVGGN